ncbi:MAG: hypothetical protein CMK65_01035 [Pseudoalteromonas sp.]|uniref:hypothetical protein n=1 Tax=Pseudoalteromonas sp. TaxID=53249 RepID=UPI000C8CC47B|nr:hypothetical protein [Pseudoalteromonas sp.]MAD02198.1 hypothetical protein [Pseudoalteromonas sp.]|tara:strand:+ start:51970 stop:53505 length:1536 start_codon:yes stop_codon:yes gene_type:complete
MHRIKKYSDVNIPDDDGIDIVQVTIDLLSQWKLILLILTIGTAISVTFIMREQRLYLVQTEFDMPTSATVSRLNEKVYKPYTSSEIFNTFYNAATSKSTLKNFIEDENVLSELFPNVKNISKNEDYYYSKVFRMLDHEAFFDNTSDGMASSNTSTSFKTLTSFRLGFIFDNERKALSLLNRYIKYLDAYLIEEEEKSQRYFVNSRIIAINKEIDKLRRKEKQSRKIKIVKLENDNNLAIESLKQKRNLLINRARQDRLTEIAILEEGNQEKLERLKLKRRLLLDKYEKDKRRQILELKEALELAQALDVDSPTPINQLSKKKNDENSITNIKIDNNGGQNLPLYLMGTQFLITQIEVVKSRDGAEYLSELAVIDMEIKLIEEDVRLSRLRDRESDERLLLELNEIAQNIELLRNDKKIADLKSRKSDDEYVPGLAALKAELESLKQIDIDLQHLKLYRISLPVVENRASLPTKKKLKLLFGFIVSLFISFFIVLLRSAIMKRQQRSLRSNE